MAAEKRRLMERRAKPEPSPSGRESLTTPPPAVKLEPPMLQALDIGPDVVVSRQPGCLWLSWKPWKPSEFMKLECELRYQPQLEGANWTLVRLRTTWRWRWGGGERASWN